MNRHCSGEYFSIAGQRKWRCNMHGNIIDMPNLDEHKCCPVCSRVIEEYDRTFQGEYPTKTVVTTQVVLRTNNWGWVTLTENKEEFRSLD